MVAPQPEINVGKESKPWKWIAFAVGAAAVATILWLLSWAFITSQIGNPDARGSFGDMFGAVNALFSGLAFAGIIVAILMQQEELKIQRKELTQSRYAQEGQVKALMMTAKLNAYTYMLTQTQEAMKITPLTTQSNIDYITTQFTEYKQKLEQVLKELENQH